MPQPKGAEQMMGAIQWMLLGEAVHAKLKRPCASVTAHECQNGSDITHDGQQDSTQDGRKESLLWREPALLREQLGVSRVLVEDGVCQSDHEANQHTEERQAADARGPASLLLKDDREGAEEHLVVSINDVWG